MIYIMNVYIIPYYIIYIINVYIGLVTVIKLVIIFIGIMTYSLILDQLDDNLADIGLDW